MIEFFHSGCAVLVGSVDASGRPHAGRGWGLTVLDAHVGRLRVLLDADDATTLTNLQPGALVAVTTASVRTLHSVQMKGRVVLVEPATEADVAKQVQYAADFANDIHEIDGDPIELVERWTNRDVVACIVDVESTFDQTPGPSAGSPMGEGPK